MFLEGGSWVLGLRYGIRCMIFGDSSFCLWGFGDWDWGFVIQGLGLPLTAGGSENRAWGSGNMGWGLGFRVWLLPLVILPVALTVRLETRPQAHISQSRPDSGLGFQVCFSPNFQVVASSLGSGLS